MVMFIKKRRDERLKEKENLKLTKFFAKMNLLLGPKYINDSKEIISQAQLLEEDVKSGRIDNIEDYEKILYKLSCDIGELYKAKEKALLDYLDVVALKRIDNNQKEELTKMYEKVEEHLQKLLSDATEVTRRCEFARMQTSWCNELPFPSRNK